jgi:hypothetical protein
VERQIQNTCNYLCLLEVISYILQQTLLIGVGFKSRSTNELLKTKLKVISYISSVLKIVMLILKTKCIYYKMWEKERTWKSLGDFVYTTSSYRKDSVNKNHTDKYNPIFKTLTTCIQYMWGNRTAVQTHWSMLFSTVQTDLLLHPTQTVVSQLVISDQDIDLLSLSILLSLFHTFVSQCTDFSQIRHVFHWGRLLLCFMVWD